MIDKSQTYVFDRDKLRAKLNSINEIKNFSFELMKNGNLLIKIIEKTPFMVLTNDNIKKYIDNNGKILKVSGIKENKYVELSGKNVLKFIDEIDKSFSYNSKNYHLIEKIVLKNHNSWFVIFRDGICLITSIKELDKTLNIKPLKVFYLPYRNYTKEGKLQGSSIKRITINVDKNFTSEITIPIDMKDISMYHFLRKCRGDDEKDNIQVDFEPGFNKALS